MTHQRLGAPYRVPHHVRSADCGDSIVLLDLRGGSYFIIQDQAAQFWRRLRGVDAGPPDGGEPLDDGERNERIAGFLVRQGLLEPEPSTPSGVPLRMLAVVGRAICVFIARLAAAQSTAMLARSAPARRLLPAVALLTSTVAVRCLPLSAIVGFFAYAAEVERRNVHELRAAGDLQGRGHATGDEQAEIDEVVRRVCDSPIRHLLPVACLELSLAMALVRLVEGRPIVWCIGARNPPFDAHAWVEATAAGPPIGSVASRYHRLVRVAV